MTTWSNDSKNLATFSNDKIYSYLRKSDLGYLLLSTGFKILIITYNGGSNIWPNESKNSAVFTNENKS